MCRLFTYKIKRYLILFTQKIKFYFRRKIMTFSVVIGSTEEDINTIKTTLDLINYLKDHPALLVNTSFDKPTLSSLSEWYSTMHSLINAEHFPTYYSEDDSTSPIATFEDR